jgi:hypothetical protein
MRAPAPSSKTSGVPGIDAPAARDAPTPATSRSTWSNCSPMSGGSRPTPDVVSRSSSTRCRTSGRRRLGAVRGLPRTQPVGPAGHRRRRRPAAPAGGAECEQVLQRAPLPLPAHRPAAARRRRPGAHGAGRRRGRVVRNRRPRCDVRRDRRLSLLHPGLRQGRLGPRPGITDHRRRRRGGSARGRGRAGRRILRVATSARLRGSGST